MVLSIGCFFKRLRFCSQYSHGGSQLSLTPVPDDPMPPSGLCRYCMPVVHRYTCRQNAQIHKIKIIIYFLKRKESKEVKIIYKYYQVKCSSMQKYNMF